MSYRNNLYKAYNGEFKKTWQMAHGVLTWPGSGPSDAAISNRKTRPVVEKRLAKLRKYIKITLPVIRMSPRPKSLRSDPE